MYCDLRPGAGIHLPHDDCHQNENKMKNKSYFLSPKTGKFAKNPEKNLRKIQKTMEIYKYLCYTVKAQVM